MIRAATSRLVVFLLVAVATGAAVLGWLGEGDPERSLRPVRTAVHAIVER